MKSMLSQIPRPLGRRLFLGWMLIFSASVVSASPAAFTYQGRILKSDGTPLEYSNVSFIFQVTDPSGSCVIYQEQVTGYNMSSSKGVFDVPIGTGTIAWPSGGGVTLLDVFQNTSSYSCASCSGYSCAAGSSTYNAASGETRRLKVQFYDGNGWKAISPDNVIRTVPFAGYSFSAEKLAGHSANAFVLKNEVNSNASCDGGAQFLTWNATTKTFGCSGVSGSNGGTVTTVTAASPLAIAVGTESSTPHITIQVASGSQGGYLTSGDWTSFNSKLGPATIFAGDISGTASNISVDKIKGVAVATSGLATGDILKYIGGNWVNGTISASEIADLSTSLGSKPDYAQFPTTCTAAQTLTFISPVGGFVCSDIAIPGSQVSGNIAGTASGFTGALSGDVTGTQSATLVSKLQGVDLSSTAPTGNQVLKFNGTQWAPASLGTGDLPSGTLSGAGTAGYLPYYSGANALANSLVYQTGGGVGIGTTTPEASSVLDISSTTKGFLPPRMTTAQRNGMSAPAAGLIVYDSTENKLYVYNGTQWAVASDSASGVFQYKRTGSMAVGGTGTPVRLIFNTKTVDVDNNYNPATGLYTAPQDGFYHFSVSNAWDSVSNTGAGVRIRTTGGATIAQLFSPGSGNVYHSASGGYYLTAGQQVEVLVWQWNGSNANIMMADFSGFRVGAGGNGGGGVADNLGNHTATQNFVLSSHWLSGDGDAEGVRIDGAGNVGIGTATPSEKLDVSGKVKANEFCLGSTCINTWPSGGGGTVDTAQLADGAVTQDKLATVSGLTAGTYGNATTIPSITVDTKGRVTAITTNTVAALPAASGASGKFLKSDGTSWSGQDIQFSDIKNIAGTSAFNIGACGANQTVAWSSLTDSFSCQLIGNLDADKIATGTLDAARLPSSVTNALWTESGGSVYRNSGNVGIGTATPSTALDVNGEIRAGNIGTACSSGNAGAIRYNSAVPQMEFCNGTSWSPMGNGLAQRQSFTTPGAFSFTVPAGVTQVRAYVAGAGGGGSSSDTTPGANGGNTTFSTVTAYAGAGGNAGSAPGTSTGADISIRGGGAYGGTGGQWDGGWGGLGIKTFTVTPGQVLTGSVGAGGAGASVGTISGQSGAHGYVILEYSGGATAASSGSGTMNYVPVWTGATALGNSPIAVSGSNVGIGTATPTYGLDVRSATYAAGGVAQASPSANVTLSANTWTKIPMANVEYDTDALMDVANGRFKPTRPGYYRVTVVLEHTLSGNPPGAFTIYSDIYKNGTSYKSFAELMNYTGGYVQSITISAVIPMNGTTDYVESYARNNLVANSVIRAGGSWMTVEFVRSL